MSDIKIKVLMTPPIPCIFCKNDTDFHVSFKEKGVFSMCSNCAPELSAEIAQSMDEIKRIVVDMAKY